jgi:undecaprenyl-diphosphatase
VTYPQAVALGVVQGVTEFLPVSSSGHLILAPHLLGWPDQGLAFDAAIHLGTLGALLAYFRGELRALASGALSPRIGLLLVLATIPGGLAGLLFDTLIEAHLRSAVVVATSTAFWAIVMAVADRRAAPPTPGGGDPLERISGGQALAIGCAQALALIPGTSRSGITITAALFGGLDRPTAARFAFLLGVPITAGAGALKILHLLRVGLPPAESGPLVAAVVAAFLSGWIAVWFLVGYVKRRSLLPFVLYRLLVAAVIFALVAR